MAKEREVLLINHGGTISQKRDGEGVLHSLTAEGLADELPGEVKMSHNIHPLDVAPGINSSDITAEHWTTLAREIKDKLNSCGSVVITHGTNTGTWTATALAFAFGRGLDTPMIVVSSQRHHGRAGSDALFNLDSAIRSAAEARRQNVAEVMVFSGMASGHVLRGVRGVKKSDKGFEIFRSPGCEALAVVGAHEITYRPHALQADPNSEINLRPYFDMEGIEVVKIHVGLGTNGLLEKINEGRMKALILQTFEEGNVPTRFLRVVEEARKKSIPVIVSPQFTEEEFFKPVPVEEQNAVSTGAVSSGNMNPDAVLIKVGHLLAQEEYKNNSDLFQQGMAKSLVGERTVVIED